MNRPRFSLRLGMLLAAALVASGCSSWLPGRTTGPLEVTATFDDVGDLFVNHSVQAADVRIGSVTSIELTDDYQALVTMSVKDVDLPADLVAELRTTSLLGEKFIELRPCEPAPPYNDVGCDSSRTGELQDGADIPAERTSQAPEFEFVAETAIELLGALTVEQGLVPDLVTILETNAAAFGGREAELVSLIDSLSITNDTLARQSSDIVRIIESLDSASATLAAGDATLDALLGNLATATTVLADNSQQAVDTLAALTELVTAQNEIVFQPYFDTMNRQIGQVDAIVQLVTESRQEVTTLVHWLERFVHGAPLSVPNDFALIKGWLVLCPGEEC